MNAPEKQIAFSGRFFVVRKLTDQQRLGKVHHHSSGGEEGAERQSALQRAVFRHMGVQEIRTCGKTCQQDDE